MKKILISLAVLALVLATSCKKSSTTSNSWTFKGNTYNVSTATVPNPGELAAACLSGNNTINGGTLDIYFYNNLTPATSGTYTVVTSPVGANQASITLVTGVGAGQATYYPTGTGNLALSVSVASNGHVTASGSGIMMSSGGTDTAALSLSITQTQ